MLDTAASTMFPPASPEPELVAHRRERRRLAWLDRTLMLVSIVFIVWVAWALMIKDRRDLFYALPSIFGSLTGVSRYFVYRVRAVPLPVVRLRSPDPAVAERAWEVVAAHRDELLAHTILPATIREPALTELPRAALIERVARVGDIDWRRVLRTFLWIWVPLALAVFAATLFFQPDPTQSY